MFYVRLCVKDGYCYGDSVRLSLSLSVCHTNDPRLRGLNYRNIV